MLFVRGNEEFGVSRPVRGGYAELIVTVRPDLLSELLGVPEPRLADHVRFRQRSAPASSALQRCGIEFLHAAAAARVAAGAAATGAADDGDGLGGDAGGSRDGELAAEEWLVGFVRASLAPAFAFGASGANGAVGTVGTVHAVATQSR